MTRWRRCKEVLRSRLLSPRGLLLRAVAPLAVLLLLHLAGARERMSVFSGTPPTGAGFSTVDQLLAALYALSYLLGVVVAPIMVLAALLSWGALLLREQRRGKRAGGQR